MITRARLVVLTLAVWAAAMSTGCSPKTPVDRAQSAYEGGDYPTALEKLEDAELAYADGRLGPEYELRYLAFRGLTNYRLWKETGDKGARRRGRPFVRRALERWESVPAAKAEGWLDEAVVKELQDAAKDVALGPPGEE